LVRPTSGRTLQVADAISSNGETSMFRNSLGIVLFLSASLTFAPPASAVPHYVITDIGVLAGNTASAAYGVNDSGQVAGQSCGYVADGNLDQHAVLYSGGTLTDLGGLVGNTTPYACAYAINDSGAVVFSVQHRAQEQSYVYNGPGNIITISQQPGYVNGSYNESLAINNNGQTAGWGPCPSNGDQSDAFYFSGGTNGTTTDIAAAANDPFYNTVGCGINNLGAVVGDGTTGEMWCYPFVWTPGGGMQPVVPVGWNACANAINDSGVVVGATAPWESWSPQGALKAALGAAFVSRPVGGGYVTTSLPSLGNGTSDGAFGISNTGTVVGQSAGDAFLATESGGTWTTTDLNRLINPNSGWTLQSANAISNNGNFICGTGTILAGQTNGFLLEQAIAGDANLDGTVDINDLTIVLANYGQTGMTWSQGEFTGDGTVDVNDLTIVLAHFGQSLGSPPAAMAAVPEPASLLLAAAGTLGLLVCAGRRRCRLSHNGVTTDN
jgi:probable HAF family extracellular repeat protein